MHAFHYRFVDWTIGKTLKIGRESGSGRDGTGAVD